MRDHADRLARIERSLEFGRKWGVDTGYGGKQAYEDALWLVAELKETRLQLRACQRAAARAEHQLMDVLDGAPEHPRGPEDGASRLPPRRAAYEVADPSAICASGSPLAIRPFSDVTDMDPDLFRRLVDAKLPPGESLDAYMDH